jgi:hypothetical protein
MSQIFRILNVLALMETNVEQIRDAAQTKITE